MTPERVHWGPQNGRLMLYRGGTAIAAFPRDEWPNACARLALSVASNGKGHIETPYGPVTLTADQTRDFLADLLAL